jgi:hypothetical protein
MRCKANVEKLYKVIDQYKDKQIQHAQNDNLSNLGILNNTILKCYYKMLGVVRSMDMISLRALGLQ